MIDKKQLYIVLYSIYCEHQFAQREKKAMIQKYKSEIITILVFFLSLLSLFFVFHKLFYSYQVASGSMEKTIMTGDFVIGNRNAKKIERGDIVLFFQSEKNQVFLKRVIAIEGDSVDIKNGDVSVNGVQEDDSYLQGRTEGEMSYVVPENAYFLLGDNRENSNDARYWKNPYIYKKDMYGKVIFSIGRCGIHIY